MLVHDGLFSSSVEWEQNVERKHTELNTSGIHPNTPL